MSPIDSESQATNFHVFKRRKKTNPKENTKIDTKNDTQTNNQEDSSEEKGSWEQATIVLKGLPTTSFPHIEETTDLHVSSTSQIETQQNIFSRYREIKKKNEAFKTTTY